MGLVRLPVSELGKEQRNMGSGWDGPFSRLRWEGVDDGILDDERAAGEKYGEGEGEKGRETR